MANVQNLASGTLTSSISASTTSLSVYVGEGSSFVIETVWPATPFYATIMPAVPNAGVANSLDSEIVKVTAVSNLNRNVILTVTRGQRGTSGKAFSEGDIVTAAVYAEDAVLLGEESTSETPTPWVGTTEIEDGAVTPEKASFTEYSTTEQVVGTWIDGKPIYRRVFNIASPQATNTNYDFVSTNIGSLIGLWGWMATSDNDVIPVPQMDNAQQTYSVIFINASGYLRGRFSFAGSVPSTVVVIAEYTKTTD